MSDPMLRPSKIDVALWFTMLGSVLISFVCLVVVFVSLARRTGLVID